MFLFRVKSSWPKMIYFVSCIKWKILSKMVVYTCDLSIQKVESEDCKAHGQLGLQEKQPLTTFPQRKLFCRFSVCLFVFKPGFLGYKTCLKENGRRYCSDSVLWPADRQVVISNTCFSIAPLTSLAAFEIPPILIWKIHSSLRVCMSAL